MLDLANQLVEEAELELATMTALVSTQPLPLSARQASSLKEARQNVLTSRSKRSDVEKKTEKDLAFIQSQRDKKLSNLLQAKKLESEAEAGTQRDYVANNSAMQIGINILQIIASSVVLFLNKPENHSVRDLLDIATVDPHSPNFERICPVEKRVLRLILLKARKLFRNRRRNVRKVMLLVIEEC